MPLSVILKCNMMEITVACSVKLYTNPNQEISEDGHCVC